MGGVVTSIQCLHELIKRVRGTPGRLDSESWRPLSGPAEIINCAHDLRVACSPDARRDVL